MFYHNVNDIITLIKCIAVCFIIIFEVTGMEYQISCGSSSAKFSTLGAEPISFIKDGTEYIWTGDTDFWYGHSPILFPTVGALKDKKAEINGVVYEMKKHGFTRKCEFELVGKTENSISFSLKSNEETKKSYPFDFELIASYTISDGSLKIEYKVINKDKGNILFGIGGHTGINCPLYDGTEFGDYYVRFETTEDGPFYYTRTDDCGGVIHREDRIPQLEGKKELKLDYSLFDKDVIVMDNMRSKAMKLLNTKNDHGVEFKMNGFSSIGFWTVPFKKAKFICLEPWTVNPDFSDNSGKFDEKPNITKLPKGKDFTVSYEINVF